MMLPPRPRRVACVEEEIIADRGGVCHRDDVGGLVLSGHAADGTAGRLGCRRASTWSRTWLVHLGSRARRRRGVPYAPPPWATCSASTSAPRSRRPRSRVDGRVEIVGLGNHAVGDPVGRCSCATTATLLVGDAAQRRGQQEPDRLAREFKRRFGDSTPIMLGHTPYSAERLMAAVLRRSSTQVTERQGGPPSPVAIAHPANWGPYKIELLAAGGAARRRCRTRVVRHRAGGGRRALRRR